MHSSSSPIRILAPLLFSIFFATLLYVAFHDCTVGILLTFNTDCSLFNLRKLQSQTKTTSAIIHELLFADDCALAAHTLQEAQTLLDHIIAACHRLGLCVSLKKTEALFQPSPDITYTAPTSSCCRHLLLPSATYSVLDPVMNKLQLAWLRQTLPLADSESGCGTTTVSA